MDLDRLVENMVKLLKISSTRKFRVLGIGIELFSKWNRPDVENRYPKKQPYSALRQIRSRYTGMAIADIGCAAVETLVTSRVQYRLDHCAMSSVRDCLCTTCDDYTYNLKRIGSTG